MALLPIHDRNPRLNIKFPYVTIGLIVANIALFIYQLGLDDKAAGAINYGFGFEDFTDDFSTWVFFYGPEGGEAAK